MAWVRRTQEICLMARGEGFPVVSKEVDGVGKVAADISTQMSIKRDNGTLAR